MNNAVPRHQPCVRIGRGQHNGLAAKNRGAAFPVTADISSSNEGGAVRKSMEVHGERRLLARRSYTYGQKPYCQREPFHTP